MNITTLLTENKTLGRYLVGVLANRAGHRKYQLDADIKYVSASVMNRLAKSNDYRVWMGVLFETVDSDFSKTGGYTKAYRFRPETIDAVNSFVLAGHARSYETPDSYREEFIHSELVKFCDGTYPTNNPQDLLAARLYLASAHSEGVSFVEYRTTYGKGRRFAVGPSLQGLPKYIRDRIVDWSTHNDLDMVNAHPSIINQMTNGAFPTINEVATNRESVLNSLQAHYGASRPEVKRMVLALFYGAGLAGPTLSKWRAENNSTVEHHQLVSDLYAELKTVRHSLPPQELLDMTGNAARALALHVQQTEDTILSSMETFIASRGLEVSTLCFDGLILRGTVDLTELSEHVLAMTGYHISFAYKTPKE